MSALLTRPFFFVAMLFVPVFLAFATKAKAQETCSKLFEGPPRGIQCLHCMHKNARKFTPLLTKALLSSCRKQVAVAYVLDDSFGFDLETIRAQITTLLAANREVTLHLYFLNGPAQRRWTLKTFNGFGNQTPPDVFRQQIMSDKKVRSAYSVLVTRVSSFISEMIELGVHISASPMLEDNLSNDAFSAMLELTKAALPIGIKYYRSACSDCYAGNQFAIPDGVYKEDHRVSKTFRQSEGIISNDGWGYVYFTKAEKVILAKPVIHSDRQEAAVNFKDLTPMLQRSTAQNNIFLLWLSKYQQTLPGSRSLPASKRAYPRPKPSELRTISHFLRD